MSRVLVKLPGGKVIHLHPEVVCLVSYEMPSGRSAMVTVAPQKVQEYVNARAYYSGWKVTQGVTKP